MKLKINKNLSAEELLKMKGYLSPNDIAMIREYETSLIPHYTRIPKEGEVHMPMEDICVHAIYNYRALLTGGTDKVLPKGLEIEILRGESEADRVPPITILARPLNPARDCIFVDSETIKCAKFAGYYLVLKTKDFADRLEKIGEDGKRFLFS